MKRATIKLSYRRMAEIAEKSAGYSVAVVESGIVFDLTDLRFRRRANGRRDRAVVECQSNGRAAAFMSDDVADVVD